MVTALKRSFVFLLAMALLVAGMPMTHAMPCEPAAQPFQMTHHHDIMPTATAEHVHDASKANSHRHADHGKLATDLCRCLNCGMCATPAVALLMRDLTPERRVFSVTYRPSTAELPDVSTSVDPGIPIALT